MLKIIPIFMKFRLQVLNSHYELLNHRYLNTSARMLLAEKASKAGNYKQDEMYFRNIIKKTVKIDDSADNNENELSKEYEEMGKKPLLNVKTDYVRKNDKYNRYVNAEQDEDEGGEEVGEDEDDTENKKPKRLNKKEKHKLEVRKIRELEGNLKKAYDEFSNPKSNEPDEKEMQREQKNDNRQARQIVYGGSQKKMPKYEQNEEKNSYRYPATGSPKNYQYPPAEKYNKKGKNNKDRKTPYEKSIFERQRRVEEEEEKLLTEMKEIDSSEAVNIEQMNVEERRSVKAYSKNRSFYEFDDEKKKFKQLQVQKDPNYQQNDSLIVSNKFLNEVQPIVDAPVEEMDEEKFMEEHIKSLKPAYRPFAYNLAYFVNDSKVLQKFIEMGVKIQRWDQNRDISEYILKLDFDRDVAPYFVFLHDLGLKSTDQLASVVYKNPWIFKESLENLKTRMNYLESKKFTKEDIAVIITKAPKWLNMPVEEVDRNLGWFQNEFKLTAAELRSIIVSRPKLAVLPLKIPSDMRFALKEFLCYTDEQIKVMLKTAPKLFTKDIDLIKNNYNYLIDVMKMSDAQISETPEVLYMPFVTLKTRYSFLKHLKRNQFDPSKPNFVSLRDISGTTDEIFCKKIAQSSLYDFEKYLKSI